MNQSVYDFEVTSIEGVKLKLSDFRGKSLLIVNTASACGLTPQYKGLQELYQKYKDHGFLVLGFPCNQFGKQEPGTDTEISTFCEKQFHVTFPLFSKTEVNGKNAHPLFRWLCQKLPGILGSETIKWNFTKFFIDQNGTPVRRFAPTDSPEYIDKTIQPWLFSK
ncbi:MAG: glutathione peroxidase [Deltaproteobacteria bacterium]|nr:glutathione peroxidase [Deltaproteobacteria bacterium]